MVYTAIAKEWTPELDDWTLKDTIANDCAYWETLRSNGDYAYLNVCKGSEQSGMYQLIVNGEELWFGTLHEINAVIKAMINMEDKHV